MRVPKPKPLQIQQTPPPSGGDENATPGEALFPAAVVVNTLPEVKSDSSACHAMLDYFEDEARAGLELVAAEERQCLYRALQATIPLLRIFGACEVSIPLLEDRSGAEATHRRITQRSGAALSSTSHHRTELVLSADRQAGARSPAYQLHLQGLTSRVPLTCSRPNTPCNPLCSHQRGADLLNDSGIDFNFRRRQRPLASARVQGPLQTQPTTQRLSYWNSSTHVSSLSVHSRATTARNRPCRHNGGEGSRDLWSESGRSHVASQLASCKQYDRFFTMLYGQQNATTEECRRSPWQHRGTGPNGLPRRVPVPRRGALHAAGHQH